MSTSTETKVIIHEGYWRDSRKLAMGQLGCNCNGGVEFHSSAVAQELLVGGEKNIQGKCLHKEYEADKVFALAEATCIKRVRKVFKYIIHIFSDPLKHRCGSST